MTTLVTGGKGFIGSHLVEYLTTLNKKVIVIDSLTYCSNPHFTCENMLFECVDICDEKSVMQILLKYNVTEIYHLAAESDVSRSFDHPYDCLDSNVKGTLVLLECLRKIGSQVRKFLYCSTDEVYGTAYETKHIENSTLLNPTNPYSASKAAAEMFCMSYIHSYKLPIVMSRMNNVYGTRQYPEKVIPRFVKRLKQGLLPQIQGGGLQKRTFLHTSDACRGLNTVFEKGKIGEIYNIGAHEEIAILDLAKRIVEIYNEVTGKNMSMNFEQIDNRPFNDLSYDMSTEKIEKELGWKPVINFEKGLYELLREMLKE